LYAAVVVLMTNNRSEGFAGHFDNMARLQLLVENTNNGSNTNNGCGCRCCSYDQQLKRRICWSFSIAWPGYSCWWKTPTTAKKNTNNGSEVSFSNMFIKTIVPAVYYFVILLFAE